MKEEIKHPKTDDGLNEFATAIITGGLLCLACYGAYKLLHKEEKPQPVIAPPSDSGILDRLLERELG